MSKSINLAFFIFGASVASIVTWIYLKKKYEQIADEEIESVKKTFAKRNEMTDNKNVGEPFLGMDLANDKLADETDMNEYNSKIQEAGYTNYSKFEINSDSNVQNHSKGSSLAYVIAPDEFGDFEDYEKISLTFYADSVLADECNEIVDDIEETVGSDSLTHFGEYEEDSVFVRNDARKCDYEILLDHRNFSDVIKNRPHSTEI